jgi:hypothetical protein
MKKSKVGFGDNGSFLVVTCDFGKRSKTTAARQLI